MHKKTLGFFQILMINVIAVGSLRTLPFSSIYGSALIFFYVLAAIGFFFPTALVCAELGTAWPNTGGIYVWVREAFGKKCSFIVIWLSWIYNAVWYPTILALIAGTITYWFDPELASNKLYMAGSVLALFWLSTWLNCYGMRLSSWISTLGALVGTVVPMLFIIALGAFWFSSGKAISPDFFTYGFFPSLASGENLAFLTTIFFGLLGLEMSATHAAEMKHPSRDYPKAVFTSAFLVLGLLILASLAIAIVVPIQDLNLAIGAMQAFTVFLETFHLKWLIPFVALCIVLGGISAVGAWVIGPTKGLRVALEDAKVFPWLSKSNSAGVPRNLLLVQAVFVSILSLAFVLFPSVNSSFWFLSIMTAQLALIVYIFLFAAALRLRYQKPDVARSFKIPFGKAGLWAVCLLGLFSCCVVIAVGFFPPAQMGIEDIKTYETALVLSLLFLGLFPLVPLWKISSKQ